jgi:hypothetical protein
MKSRAQKTPIIAVSIMRMQNMNSLTLRSMAVHEQRMQSGARSVVRRIRKIVMPSIPRT